MLVVVCVYLCSSSLLKCSVSCSWEFSWLLCSSLSCRRLFSCLRASHSFLLCSSLVVRLARLSRSFSFSFCLSGGNKNVYMLTLNASSLTHPTGKIISVAIDLIEKLFPIKRVCLPLKPKLSCSFRA